MAAFSAKDFYDAELSRHNLLFRDAASVGLNDQVLDIGCGAGQTTREAAQAALDGYALGVDLSAEMLAVARQRSAMAGLCNVAFEQADAQERAFKAARYDLCISRFGMMFFENPAAAFTNISQAVRPGGRFAFMVWQRYERNEWAVAIREALGPGTAQSGKDASAFSLGSRRVTEELLRVAGLTDVRFAEVREPVFYGSDTNAAYDAILGLQFVQNALGRPESDDLLRRRLIDLLTAHQTPEGVLFDSRAWIVTARKPGE